MSNTKKNEYLDSIQELPGMLLTPFERSIVVCVSKCELMNIPATEPVLREFITYLFLAREKPIPLGSMRDDTIDLIPDLVEEGTLILNADGEYSIPRMMPFVAAPSHKPFSPTVTLDESDHFLFNAVEYLTLTDRPIERYGIQEKLTQLFLNCHRTGPFVDQYNEAAGRLSSMIDRGLIVLDSDNQDTYSRILTTPYQFE